MGRFSGLGLGALGVEGRDWRPDPLGPRDYNSLVYRAEYIDGEYERKQALINVAYGL